MKAHWWSTGIRIIDIGTRLSWVVSFTPWPLYPHGRSPWYPLVRRPCGPQCRSGRGGEEKNPQPLPGLELPIIQTVAQRHTTELFRLLVVHKYRTEKQNHRNVTTDGFMCIHHAARTRADLWRDTKWSHRKFIIVFTISNDLPRTFHSYLRLLV
jgi:hypothetical protein